MSSEQRLSVHDVDPNAYEAVRGMERYVREGSLGPRLLALIKIRASQINGCAYCLDMHAREARAASEEQRRLDILSAWREAAHLFSERERAALAFTEAVTRIGEAGVPDPVLDDVTRHFDRDEVFHLLMAVAVINVWNRLAITTRQALPNPGQPTR
jgi:AhpD family alkylhydroperoxidase